MDLARRHRLFYLFFFSIDSSFIRSTCTRLYGQRWRGIPQSRPPHHHRLKELLTQSRTSRSSSVWSRPKSRRPYSRSHRAIAIVIALARCNIMWMYVYYIYRYCVRRLAYTYIYIDKYITRQHNYRSIIITRYWRTRCVQYYAYL
jgi:hypothetical protein